jgi:hypothetical protein
MIEEALKRSANRVCAGTTIYHGTCEKIILFHAIWMCSSSLDPLFHHVLPDIWILLPRIDRRQCSVKDVVAWCKLEVVDERVGKQVAVKPVVVTDHCDVETQEARVGDSPTDVLCLLNEAERFREGDFSDNIETEAT